jgi:hypothetical protein
VRRRWIVILAATATLVGGVTVAAALRYLIPQLTMADFRFDGTENQVDIDAYYMWINSGWPYYSMVPWLATVSLLAGVAALALAARRAQLAGSASATASRDASSAASVSAGSAESIS